MTTDTYDADVALYMPMRAPGVEQSYALRALQGLQLAGYRTVLIDSSRSSDDATHRNVHYALYELLDPIMLVIAEPNRAYRVQVALAVQPSVCAPLDALEVNVVADGSVLVADFDFVDDAKTSDEDIHQSLKCLARATRVDPSVAILRTEHRSRFVELGVHVLPLEWSFGAPETRLREPRSAAQHGDAIRIGRHTSYEEPQWPKDDAVIRRSLPTTYEWEVSVFGQHRKLLTAVGRNPKNWSLHHVVGPRDLSTIDFWTLVHEGTRKSRADLAIDEAIASGAVVILPAALQPCYGDGAVYTSSGPRTAAQKLANDPQRYAAQSKRAVNYAYAHRAELIVEGLGHVGLRAPSKPPTLVAKRLEPRGQRERHRVMFVTSNGAGMGHLTRLLGIARKLRDDVEVVFVSLSKASPVVETFGFPFVYIASDAESQLGGRLWNDYIYGRFTDELELFQPDVIVFDGTWIYSGLMKAIKDVQIPLIWSRRGMWKSTVTDRPLLDAKSTVAVVEPGEFAADADQGATSRIDDVVRTEPVTVLDQDELFAQSEARERLCLRPDERAVLITLGAGNLNSTDEISAEVVEAFSEVAPDWRIFMTSNPISAGKSVFEHVESLEYYPVVELAAAFDATVSAAGYNSFHEWMMASVPTIWIPNLETQTDDQGARARFAEEVGVGIAVNDPRPDQLREAVRRITDDAARASMEQSLESRGRVNGAWQAAERIKTVLMRGRHA